MILVGRLAMRCVWCGNIVHYPMREMKAALLVPKECSSCLAIHVLFWIQRNIILPQPLHHHLFGGGTLTFLAPSSSDLHDLWSSSSWSWPWFRFSVGSLGRRTSSSSVRLVRIVESAEERDDEAESKELRCWAAPGWVSGFSATPSSSSPSSTVAV